MQLPILRALAMAAVGNAALAGRDVASFNGSSLFRYSRQVEFVVPKGDEQYEQIAPDPAAWFAWLRANGCRGLRLHTAPMEQRPERLGHVEERRLVGFVGGGPRWLIETVGAGVSEIWEGHDRLGDRKDPGRRIWLTAYVRLGETTPQTDADHDVTGAERELESALTEIGAFARQLEYQEHFADVFDHARSVLSGTAPNYPGLDFLDLTDLSDEARRLLAASAEAWVFGGMGSWNDGAPNEPYVKDYERLSELLFQALQRAIIAVANSSYRG